MEAGVGAVVLEEDGESVEDIMTVCAPPVGSELQSIQVDKPESSSRARWVRPCQVEVGNTI